MSNTVKLSTTTIDILQNFATINSSILFKKGNVLKTISNAQNILARAVVEEEFPQDFAIYDLSQLLAAICLFDEPVLVFDNKNYVTIKDSTKGRRSKYYFSNPEITMRNAPDREIKFPGGNINFEVSNGNLKSLTKAAAVYGLPDFTVRSEQDTVTLQSRDKEDDTSNTYDQIVSGNSDDEYTLDFKVENLKLFGINTIQRTDRCHYSVSVSSRMISEWKFSEFDLTYFIALEP
jgi:hypothetical protein